MRIDVIQVPNSTYLPITTQEDIEWAHEQIMRKQDHVDYSDYDDFEARLIKSIEEEAEKYEREQSAA